MEKGGRRENPLPNLYFHPSSHNPRVRACMHVLLFYAVYETGKACLFFLLEQAFRQQTCASHLYLLFKSEAP